MTATVTVRLSEHERRELKKRGNVSKIVREAIALYLRTEKSEQAIARLKDLQRRRLRTSIEDDLRLLRTDRDR
jgi:hypothetical protein